ncbi:hypothetical protein Agub_g6696, partial [Astrephomene gubernaculifera]
EMRPALVRYVVFPLLAAAPASYRVEWYGTFVRRMVQHLHVTAGSGGAGPSAPPDVPQLMNSWVCYLLIEGMYGMCTVQEVNLVWEKANRSARLPAEQLRNAPLRALCRRELCRPPPPPSQNAHDMEYR